jgi:hypothetical protein
VTEPLVCQGRCARWRRPTAGCGQKVSWLMARDGYDAWLCDFAAAVTATTNDREAYGRLFGVLRDAAAQLPALPEPNAPTV